MKRLFVITVAFAPMLTHAQLKPLQPLTDAELATYTTAPSSVLPKCLTTELLVNAWFTRALASNSFARPIPFN